MAQKKVRRPLPIGPAAGNAWSRGSGRSGSGSKSRALDSAPVGFAFDAFSYDTDTGAPVLAAALGFRVFLFQVPFVCFFMIAAGYLADLIDRDPSTLFHGGGIAELTAESVTATANHSDTTRVIAFLLVGYALFLGARSFVKVLHIVHALVWDVPRTKPANTTRAALVFIGFVAVAVAIAGLVDKLRYHFLVNVDPLDPGAHAGAVRGVVVRVVVAPAPQVPADRTDAGRCALRRSAAVALQIAVGCLAASPPRQQERRVRHARRLDRAPAVGAISSGG